jgi:hypothetical protein
MNNVKVETRVWFRTLSSLSESITSELAEATQLLGRAIAQAVSRRLPTAAARVQPRVWSCGILKILDPTGTRTPTSQSSSP